MWVLGDPYLVDLAQSTTDYRKKKKKEVQKMKNILQGVEA